MPKIYYEESTYDGRWKSVTAAQRPVTKVSCGITRDINGLRRVRAITELPDYHGHLSLNQLAAVYSPDGAFNTSK